MCHSVHAPLLGVKQSRPYSNLNSNLFRLSFFASHISPPLSSTVCQQLQSFDDVEGEMLMISDLVDGVACAEVLHQL